MVAAPGVSSSGTITSGRWKKNLGVELLSPLFPLSFALPLCSDRPTLEDKDIEGWNLRTSEERRWDKEHVSPSLFSQFRVFAKYGGSHWVGEHLSSLALPRRTSTSDSKVRGRGETVTEDERAEEKRRGTERKRKEEERRGSEAERGQAEWPGTPRRKNSADCVRAA